MDSAIGRWVSGADFFDRQSELAILEDRVRGGNHTLLTGQRRMGKTSIARELGRRLEEDGWGLLFADVEGATCQEDVIASIAEAAHPIRPVSSRLATSLQRLVRVNVDEVSAFDFRVKIRAGLSAGSWRRYGEQLLSDCAAHKQPILLVIDELPIFLKRLRDRDAGAQQVESFLSWLRGVIQRFTGTSLVLIVSGSIGLEPLVRQMGISDRVNYLAPFRLRPWDLDTSVACFERLANTHELTVEAGVAAAVYNAIGIGIPFHVQCFFAQLRESSIMSGHGRVALEDVDTVYQTRLLGPSGQNDLSHYETRLQDGLAGESYGLAMVILAEAATQGQFTPSARSALELQYKPIIGDASGQVQDVLDVLEHDGYLEDSDEGFRFLSRLLKDWWSARFQQSHTPIEERGVQHV